MNQQSILIKQLAKPIEYFGLKALMLAILECLPDIVIIADVTVSKNQISLVGDTKNILSIIVNDTNQQTVLIGQLPDGNNNYNLLSTLTESDYGKLILAKIKPQSSYSQDLCSYNLISDSCLNKQISSLQNSATPRKPLQVFPSANSRIQSAIAQHAGQLYFQHHLDQESWFYMLKMINLLNDGDIQMCYLELPEIILAPLFEIFNQTGNVRLLQKHLDATILMFPQLNPLFVEICNACFKKKIRVMPVDVVLATDTTMLQATFSQMREDLIIHSIAVNQAKHAGAKFIGLFGLAHFRIAHAVNATSIGLIPRPSAVKNFIIADEVVDYCQSLASNFSHAFKSPVSSYSNGVYKYGMFAMLAAAGIAMVHHNVTEWMKPNNH